MAAALRFAARRICGRALQGSQAYLKTAAEAAIKEGRQRLLPRISHGASSVRRFASSESASLVNNTNTVPFTGGLAKQVDLAKHELFSLLRQKEGVEAAKSASVAVDNKELIRMVRGSNEDFLSSLYKSMAGTVAAIVATVYLEAKVIKAWHKKKYSA